MIIKEAIKLDDIEGLIIPDGPIRDQHEVLTELIQRLDREGKMLAAIWPQYLGRAGVLNESTFTTFCSIERIHKLRVDDPFPRRNYVDMRVVRDKHIFTAKGRAFVDFSFEIFDYLGIYLDLEEEKQQL